MQGEAQKRDHGGSAYSIPLLTPVDGVFGMDNWWATAVLAQNSQKPVKHRAFDAPVIPSSACFGFCPPSVPCPRSGFAAAPRWSSNSSPCDIATSVARPEPFTATEPMQPSRRRASSRSALASLRCTRAQSPRRETWSQESGALVKYRISSSATFIGTPLAGAWLLAHNLQLLGQAHRVAMVWGISVFLLVVTLVLAFVLPEEVPAMPFAIAQLMAMIMLAKNLMEADLKQHAEAGGALLSNWRAAGIGLMFTLGLAALMFAVLMIFVYAGAVVAMFLFIVMLLDLQGGKRPAFTTATSLAAARKEVEPVDPEALGRFLPAWHRIDRRHQRGKHLRQQDEAVGLKPLDRRVKTGRVDKGLQDQDGMAKVGYRVCRDPLFTEGEDPRAQIGHMPVRKDEEAGVVGEVFESIVLMPIGPADPLVALPGRVEDVLPEGGELADAPLETIVRKAQGAAFDQRLWRRLYLAHLINLLIDSFCIFFPPNISSIFIYSSREVF